MSETIRLDDGQVRRVEGAAGKAEKAAGAAESFSRAATSAAGTAGNLAGRLDRALDRLAKLREDLIRAGASAETLDDLRQGSEIGQGAFSGLKAGAKGGLVSAAAGLVGGALLAAGQRDRRIEGRALEVQAQNEAFLFEKRLREEAERRQREREERSAAVVRARRAAAVRVGSR